MDSEFDAAGVMNGPGLLALVDDLDVMVWELDVETNQFRFVAGRFPPALGYSREEWFDPGFWVSRVASEDRERFLNERRSAVSGRDTVTTEYQVNTRGGRTIWVRDSFRTARVGDRLVLRGIVFDVTPHYWTEEALREMKDRYRGLVEEINEVVFTVDESGFVTYVSPVVERVTGFKTSEIVGRSFSDFIEPDDRQQVFEAFQKVVNGVPSPAEYRIRKKNGDLLRVRTNSRPIRDGADIIGIRGVMMDLTDLGS